MLPQEKLHFLDSYLPSKYDILLDYVSFSPKKEISEETFFDLWKKHVHDHPTQFYLHIPFCSRICKYCMYNTIELRGEGEVEKYIEALIGFLTQYIEPFRQVEFQGIYVGGGTPSILDLKQMERLFGFIFGNFRFSGDFYKTIELNPSSTNLPKLTKLYSLGFDRISFGVQSFNKKTLATENRTYVSPERIQLLVEYAKKLGFSDINTDLIFGLNEEKEGDFIESLRLIKDVSPYSITIYTILKDMERSALYEENTDIFYKRILDSYNNAISSTGMQDLFYEDDWSNVLGFKLINKNGHTPKRTYEAHTSESVSLFGVGYKAFGKIWGQGSYETISNDSTFGHVFEHSSFQQELFSYVLQKFQFRIQKNDFKTKFGIEFGKVFHLEIEYLLQHGVIRDDEDAIVYIGPNNLVGYYGLIFLDIAHIIKFIKYRYHNP